MGYSGIYVYLRLSFPLFPEANEGTEDLDWTNLPGKPHKKERKNEELKKKKNRIGRGKHENKPSESESNCLGFIFFFRSLFSTM
jgi:hypothetical protein